MAIYNGMLGVAELYSSEEFCDFVLSQSDETISRNSPQKLWEMFNGANSSPVTRNEKALEA